MFVINIMDLCVMQILGGYMFYSVIYIGGGMVSYCIVVVDQFIEMILVCVWGLQVGYLDWFVVVLVNVGGGMVIFGMGLLNLIGSGVMLDVLGGLDSVVVFGGMGGLGCDVKLMGSFIILQGEFIFFVCDNCFMFEMWCVNVDGSISVVVKFDLFWGLGIFGMQIDDMKIVVIGDWIFMFSMLVQGNYLVIQGVNGDGILGVVWLLWVDCGLGLNVFSYIVIVMVMGVIYLVVVLV